MTGVAGGGAVVIHKVVDPFAADSESISHAIPVDFLPGTVHPAGFDHVHIGIHEHLGVAAQVLQIAFGDQFADCVGQAADTQLNNAAVPLFYPRVFAAIIFSASLGSTAGAS